jgi:hypothetical protein
MVWQRGRDRVVGIVTGLQTGRPTNHGSIPGNDQEIYPFSKTSSPDRTPTQRPATVGTGSSFSGAKCPGREADVVAKLGMRGVSLKLGFAEAQGEYS